MDLGREVWIVGRINIGYHLGPNLVVHDAHLDVITAALIEQCKLSVLRIVYTRFAGWYAHRNAQLRPPALQRCD